MMYEMRGKLANGIEDRSMYTSAHIHTTNLLRTHSGHWRGVGRTREIVCVVHDTTW